MGCGCKTSGNSSHSCSTKSVDGCASVNTCGSSYKLNVFDWLANIQSPNKEKNKIVEVRFKNERKSYYKNVENLPLRVGSLVTVEALPGHDIGVVSLTGELVRAQLKRKGIISEDYLAKVYRLSTQKDLDTWKEAREREESLKVEARKIARSLNLEMKITDIEFQGDGTKMTLYYTAETRVDFRQLIKEYALLFRTKIDMKQIGYRQEAAKVGGIGSCGRALCCSSWLADFRSVNTNAARYQQLSINPLKLAGQCGKLKCCLNYELDSYMDALSHFPSTNTVLQTEKGKAFCIKIDVFKKKMWFSYVENSMMWFDLDIENVKKMLAMNQKGTPVGSLEEYQTTVEPLVSVDLIQENRVDRFEKKRTKKSNKPQNKNKKVPLSLKKEIGENQPLQTKEVTENKKTRNPTQKSKKNNRKPPPKKDNNV